MKVKLINPCNSKTLCFTPPPPKKKKKKKKNRLLYIHRIESRSGMGIYTKIHSELEKNLNDFKQPKHSFILMTNLMFFNYMFSFTTAIWAPKFGFKRPRYQE